MAVDNYCLHNKYGHCRYGEKCKYNHLKEICENIGCENRHICNKRHPKLCRYFQDFGRCKFSEYCSFNHTTSDLIMKNPETSG